MTRRALLQMTAAGLLPAPRRTRLIFIHMAGGPSQSDLFDFQASESTPADLRPYGALRFPRGLMPKLADLLDECMLVRGIEAESTDHGRARAWMNFAPAVHTTQDMFRGACEQARRESHDVLLRLGGWDHHGNLYEQLRPLARRFDDGVAALITGLKRDGTLGSTRIVAMGEFGRRPGPLNQNGGRDHHPVHAALVAGGIVRGGRAIRCRSAAQMIESLDRGVQGDG